VDVDARRPIPAIESVPNIPVFSHGLLMCEIRDGNVEVALYLDQTHIEGGAERVVNHRHIMPVEGAIDALIKLTAKLPRAAAFRIMTAVRQMLTGHGIAS
jgi:hypothetical protein